MWSKCILSCTLLLFVLNSVQSQTVVNFSEYTAIMDDSTGLARTVFYRLTKEMVNPEKKYKRPQSFYKGENFVTKDYENTGYHRGHLKPYYHSTWDEEVAKEANKMDNIAPQTPFINQGVIKSLESFIVQLAKYHECMLVWIHIDYDGEMITDKLANPSLFTYDLRDCENQPITLSFENISK